MAFSSYQMERLLDRLRRWRGWFDGTLRGAPLLPERVRLTPAALERAGARGGAGPASSARADGPGVAGGDLLRRVGEQEPYPPEVEAERERRAGSFMNPPYPESGRASSIPRLAPGRKKRRGVRPATRPRGVGD
jgi:hypothetical protein